MTELMLIGDLNVIDVQWIIQYRIEDPIRYLFQVRARSAQQPTARCRRSRANPTLKRLRSTAGAYADEIYQAF